MRGTLHQAVQVKGCIPPDSYAAATVNGATIDTRGFAEIMFTAYTRVATGTVDFHIEHGDESDASDMADVSGLTFTQITSSNDGEVFVGRINCHSIKRYCRIVGVVATDVVEMTSIAQLGSPETWPVTQDNTVAFNQLV